MMEFNTRNIILTYNFKDHGECIIESIKICERVPASVCVSRAFNYV